MLDSPPLLGRPHLLVSLFKFKPTPPRALSFPALSLHRIRLRRFNQISGNASLDFHDTSSSFSSSRRTRLRIRNVGFYYRNALCHAALTSFLFLFSFFIVITERGSSQFLSRFCPLRRRSCRFSNFLRAPSPSRRNRSTISGIRANSPEGLPGRFNRKVRLV